MPDQIYIGNFAKGLRTSRLPFNIDNDSFPYLFNFYVWRGRVKRKRGTIFLGQLRRQLSTSITAFSSAGAGASVFNLFNLLGLLTTEPGASLVPGTVSNPFTIVIQAPINQTLTDTTGTGVMTISGAGTVITAATLNYGTGFLTLTFSGAAAASATFATFSYYPGLPVMGLADFVSPNSNTDYPLLLAFDTKYSYQIRETAGLVNFYSTSYYKITNNPVVWTGKDYQQFWTTNYSGALWATNNVPGLNLVYATYVAGSGTMVITLNMVYPAYSTSSGAPFTTLILNDELFFNEFVSGSTINGQTGIVTTVVGGGQYIITFTSIVTVSGQGAAQTLTNSIGDQDGIRWYDGDPTSGTGLPTGTGLGWVNFSPPLTALAVSIDNTTVGSYYLVGALAILPFKDRILFFSPYIQTSGLGTSTGLVIQLKDTVLWSWNGTPYYSSLTPTGETFDVRAYYVDQTGFGGYLPAGIPQAIATVSNNEDVLLIGFSGDGRKTRFVYTGNDIQPFLFFNINSELPSSATFSAIAMDRGVIDIGQYGIAMTDQQSSQRIDLDIPDSVFQIQALNNGAQRVNAIRDFFKEWIYFSYPVNNSKRPESGGSWKFPTQTFLLNYRDNTWSVLYENFTTHGTYRPQFKKTWRTTGFKTWNSWREAWNSGSSSPEFPNIIAGNPQGYVLIKGQGTSEGISGTIASIANNGGNTQITSVNHCVSVGDYLLITNAIGLLTSTITSISQSNPTVITTVNTFSANSMVTISNVVGMTELNGNTYNIISSTGTSITINVDSSNFTAYTSGGTVTSAFNNIIGLVISIINIDNFIIDILFPSGTYLGLGNYTRLSQPFLQTKQFPFYWEQGRKTILKVQKYLMDTTSQGQVTVNIYLSQDPDDVWNDPSINTPPNGLVYSQLMYTCPESTNIGLTPANTNLQMPTAPSQFQIWHRFNTSLVGDSIQIGITLSDAQMRNLAFATDEITLHGMNLTVDKGPQLA